MGEYVKIPYPDEEIDYPVVYKRLSTNLFWQKRYDPAYYQIPSSLEFDFPFDKIKSFIQSAAAHERAKEDEFLSKFYKITNDKTPRSRTEQFKILF